MNILITGGSGVIGECLVREALARGHETSFTYHSRPSPIGNAQPIRLSLEEPARLAESLSSCKPDVLIHSAAFTNVDGCETEQEKARIQNAQASGELAKFAKSRGALFIYISTSFVFPKRDHAVREDEEPAPVNYYGQSKLDGELALRAVGGEWQIWRTDQPYGWVPPGQKQNTVTRTLSLLKEGKEVREVEDWWNNPTYLPDFAAAGFALIEKRAQGIYHLVGSSYATRADWARATASAFGYNPALILTKRAGDMRLPAARPNVNADNSKVQKETGVRMRTIEEALRDMRADPRAVEFVSKGK
ncbi:RmlD substrate binding domain protein [uncultured archaeon]|nr:RmlD substrate binding domain protein [uncultured archaeon]